MYRSESFITGSLKKSQHRLFLVTLFTAIASLQEFGGVFFSLDSVVAQIIIKYHIGAIAYLVVSSFIVYTAGKLRKDLADAYAETLEHYSSYENPYAQLIEAIVKKFSSLIGAEIALARLSEVAIVEPRQGGEFVIAEGVSTEVGVHAIEQIGAAYTDLLGDSAQDFILDVSKQYKTKYPDLVLPQTKL